MPHASLKLIPGVDQNRTLALNEAAISESNLIRFVPDRQGLGLVQKLGGWTRFYNSPIDSKVRCLWAWQTLNDESYLAVGAEGSLSTISNNSLRNISPQYYVVNAPVSFSTTAGSPVVTITDVRSSIDDYDAVWIDTQVTVGGLRLQGLYRCTALSANTYSITATDVLGFDQPATSTVVNGGDIPDFTTTAGSAIVTVALTDHQYVVGDTVTFLVSTVVGGITIFGNYIVADVPSANSFIINASNTAATAQTLPINNGLARFTYYNGIGPLASGSGYGIGGYGSGGYGSGIAPSAFRTMVTIGAKGNGTTATLSHTTNVKLAVGTEVTVSGVTPLGYNTGAPVLITASTSNVFNITNVVGNGTTVTVTHDGSAAIETGTFMTISGVNPGAYNGTWAVTGSTTSTVSFASAVTTAYVSGGIVASNTISYLNATTGAQTVSGLITINQLTNLQALDWTLDNWGEILIACPNFVSADPGQPDDYLTGGGIFYYQPGTGSPVANIIPNAPPANHGIFVAMPQRQIIAWGSTFTGIQDPLLIRWSDVGNFNVWAGDVTNQAGSYRIPKGSTIVGCIQGPQQGLVWTDLAVWAMQYVGPPYVYSFNEIGTGCGLIAPKAAISMNGVVYWMSQSQFFRLSGSGVEPIACPIWDVIFQDLDTNNLNKIRIAPNSRFGEITWYYPTSGNGGEVSHYVKYNVYMNQWDFGAIGRTAWINQSVFGPPIGATTDNIIVQHETSTDADGQAMNSYFQTGYFQLNDGDLLTFVDQFWPDAKWGYYGGTQNANLLLTFYVTQYAGDQPIAYGPFTLTEATQYVTPRLRGRLVSIKIESNDVGTFWRLGNMRYRFQQDGKF
jgi:hypothetical protein